MSKEMDALDDFGASLVRTVRDPSIKHWNAVLNGGMKDAHSKELFQEASGFSQRQSELVNRLISMAVDTTLHNLLLMLEQTPRIMVTVETGFGRVESLASVSDGLTGELYGPDGWFERFASEYYEEP